LDLRRKLLGLPIDITVKDSFMDSSKVLIIAEAGVNHNADLQLAIKMIETAKDCGADVVKFQTAVPELVMTKQAPKAQYQIDNTQDTSNQLEMAKKLHFPLATYKRLQDYCRKVDIEFMSTPFDFASIDCLTNLQVKTYKIPSGEINNTPFLRKIGGLKRNVILSTGMANLEEIQYALNVLLNAGSNLENIALLHCTTEYPAPIEEVNLRCIQTLRNKFGVSVGYSDHTMGIEVAIAAVALGATILEKHFTLDSSMPGPDQKASLEPTEFKNMVRAIRNIEKALGKGLKTPTASEIKNMIVARKSIVASCSISKGEVFTDQNLTTKPVLFPRGKFLLTKISPPKGLGMA
jgi:N,N'-diacetyllegionaminate synthase